jgi:ribosomal-protein-alanine N-acetyltransferase
VLIGKNIWLKPITVEDARLLADWFNDPEYLGEFFNIWPVTRQDWERHYLDDDVKEAKKYLIVNREDDKPVGTIGNWNPFTLGECFRGKELWWHVHPDYRKRGIATQAVCITINHLFSATPIERLQATIVHGNDASCRVAEAAGMQRDGVYRSVMFLHGRYVDMHLYSIVRGDWKDEETYRKDKRKF